MLEPTGDFSDVDDDDGDDDDNAQAVRGRQRGVRVGNPQPAIHGDLAGLTLTPIRRQNPSDSGSNSSGSDSSSTTADESES